MIRAVIDANVIISGLFWQGSPQQVYREMVNGRLVMLTTEDL
jgi:predicted nucleic acid-binding protein